MVNYTLVKFYVRQGGGGTKIPDAMMFSTVVVLGLTPKYILVLWVLKYTNRKPGMGFICILAEFHPICKIKITKFMYKINKFYPSVLLAYFLF